MILFHLVFNNFHEKSQIISLIFNTLLFGSLFCIIAFWIWFYIGSQKLTKAKIPFSNSYPPVSVIISYKNAEATIAQTINTILAQDYPTFEVIAINDYSIDYSATIVHNIKDTRLTTLNASVDIPGKKSALTQAISHAKYEILLFTDADCLPYSDQWIRLMTSKLGAESHNEIVLGYGPMYATETWINTFARYETILTAMQYFTYSMYQLTYMGVGRNLMYKKSTFDRIQGFTRHVDIMSGDDDLFISEASNDKNTVIMTQRNSFVYSASKESLSAFIRQKSRHVSTSFHYRWIHKVLLAAFAVSQIIFYVVMAVGWYYGQWSLLSCLVIICGKWCIQMMTQSKYFDHLDGSDIKKYFPLLDICMALYYLMMPILSFLRSKKW